MKNKSIAIFVYDDVEVLDFAGPYEVFSIANYLAKKKIFDLFLLSCDKTEITGRNNFTFLTHFTLKDHPPINCLIIPGGPGSRSVEKDSGVINWIEAQYPKLDFLLTICTGSRILAKTNILNGEEITTHWNSVADLKLEKHFKVVENVPFTDNGKIMTSAGVSSGIDLCLYFLGKLYGKEKAKKVAKYIEWK